MLVLDVLVLLLCSSVCLNASEIITRCLIFLQSHLEAQCIHGSNIIISLALLLQGPSLAGAG